MARTRTRAAVYVRGSTTDQSTENQLPDLEALAEQRGFTVTEVFSENVSAVKTRPEFDNMIAAAHRGKFDVVLVWSLDRLHRSMVGALQTVLDLDRRGVQIVSVREPWLDTGGPVRSLLIAIFGWVAARAADLRNWFKYGNKAGPSAADLYDKLGSWDAVIESLKRTNPTINRMTGN